MALVKSGVPFEVAMALEDHERRGLIVIFGELDGGRFDWDRMKWVDSDGS